MLNLFHKLRRIALSKTIMLGLCADWVALVRLHTLGYESACGAYAGDAIADPVALRLRPVHGRPLWCRPGSSDLGALWEVFGNKDYTIPRRFLRNPRTILDLGANVGYAAAFFAHRYPNARIVAVEPDAENLKMARRNAISVRCGDRCRFVRGAAWNRETVVHLHHEGPAYAYHVEQQAAPGRIPVRAFSVPALLRQAGMTHVDLMKVDIEGAERQVFATAGEWARNVSCIICELHGSYTFEHFRRDLEPVGFICHPADKHTGLRLPLAVRERRSYPRR